MQHSSSRPSSPIPFKGFGICIAGVLAAYLVLIGSLGIGIQHTLDRSDSVATSSTGAAGSDGAVTLSGDASVVKANAAE